eukprot:CAMPEP_0202887858 /NCGR_PEP_ID=MMETSP1391-20130828/42899_1 /ASSEMBLY_ACC=CAM_ASM_000867 /TAXON_ID=1034604 /ORGANISM="Chlamydomonas leiostraca, Strain SAG 11-49" /LENGTH=139 /DNA_ID=CAMNT_0049571157 /DNA_START=196 /DNA_END=615 /DNA_ORIENTATION=+
MADVYHGAMSQETKEKYLAKGVDCQETYEMQGYESPETIFRMFSLTQHDFYLLNPGVGMDFPAGMVICVKGIWGVSNMDKPMAWFWPTMAVVAAVAGFALAMALSSWRQAQPQQHAHGHGHGHAQAHSSHPPAQGDATV